MRFLYVRRPVGFLFVGRDLPDGFIWDVPNVIQQDVLRRGYAFEGRKENDLAAIAVVVRSMEPIPRSNTLTLDATARAIRQATVVPGLRSDRV